MKRFPLTAIIAALALTITILACGGGDKPASDITDIIPPGARLVKISMDVEFDTAGSPLWDDGTLFFTNNCFDPADRSITYRMDPDGTTSIIRPDNGVTTTIQKSGSGTYYCCEMLGHRVVEMDRDGAIVSVVSGEYEGTRVDGPNDIVIDAKGGIYYSDSQFIGDQEKTQDTPAVYYVTPAPERKTIRVLDDAVFPNGLAISPCGKTLYVANTRVQHMRAYDINPDGTVSNGREFYAVEIPPEAEGQSGADGVAVDSAGNIYIATTKGFGIQVVSPEGVHLGNIPCEAITNNLNFGGDDLKTLYVSAKDGIYEIPVLIPGLPLPMP
jgi:gluconolactonase